MGIQFGESRTFCEEYILVYPGLETGICDFSVAES